MKCPPDYKEENMSFEQIDFNIELMSTLKIMF